jgi:flagellar protein FlaJ
MSVNVRAIDKLAYDIFGKFGKGEKYKELQRPLRQARIGVPFDVYISRALLMSLVLSFPCGIITAYLFLNAFPEASFFGRYGYIIFVPSFSLFFALSLYQLFLAYPAFISNIRARKIDVSLPNAIALMHALSRGGGSVIEFFEIISKNKDLYGEVATEMDMIMKDIKVFNCDIRVAMENAMSNTPSENFKNFLESLLTVISSGGSLTAFLASKSEQYRVMALHKNREFMELIGLLSEVYITGFAAGPLFIIALLMVMGILGGTDYFLLTIIIYALVPGSALMFIILLSSIVEGEEFSVVEAGKKEEQQELIDVKRKEEEKELKHEEREILKKADFRFRIKQIVSDPLRAFIEKPEKVLYIFVPVSLLFFAIAAYKCFTIKDIELFIAAIDDYLIFTVLIALTAYSVFTEIHFRRVMKIGANFPEFLNRLSSLHESGLTLPRAISSVRKSELGVMNTEIRRIDGDIKWGSSVTEAMERFGQRIKMKSIARAATLIKVASESSGNIQKTLSIAATDGLVSKTLSQERRSSMKPQIIIIYITFFIFLYVAFIIVTGFLSGIPEVPSAEGAAAATEIGIGGVDVELSKRLFFHASAILGLFSGFVAGTMGEGNARLGLKHSLIMLLIAYIAFSFFV